MKKSTILEVKKMDIENMLIGATLQNQWIKSISASKKEIDKTDIQIINSLLEKSIKRLDMIQEEKTTSSIDFEAIKNIK